MINYHPDINMLVEYTNGSLPWAVSLGVAAHLQLCPHCRQNTAQMSILGGIQLIDAPKEQLANDSFDRLINRIQSKNAEPKKNNGVIVAKNTMESACVSSLPKVIQKLLTHKLKWKKINRSLSMARLTTGQQHYEVAFHKINKGGKVVEHDHRGLEITLVLDGSFSDEQGVYQRGDFLVREPGHTHRPTATLNQDCLCLSVCEAPIKMTGMLGYFINPLLRIKPA